MVGRSGLLALGFMVEGGGEALRRGCDDSRPGLRDRMVNLAIIFVKLGL